MQVNIQKLQGIVTGVLAIGIVGFSIYFLYTVFMTGPVPELSPSLSTVNSGAFAGVPKVQKVAEAVKGTGEKFALKKKNYQFIEKPVYKSFTNDPVDVPLSEKRGRADPFAPYAP